MSGEITGAVFNIQKFCIHDGPGIRTTVFFKGCPLRCRWCANPESQAVHSQVMYDRSLCLRCGCCEKACPNGGIHLTDDGVVIDRDLCTGCGSCVNACAIYGGKALSMQGDLKTVDEVVAEVLKDQVFYQSSGGGATFSGGEVLSQLEFAEAIAVQLKRHGIHIACETAGYAPPEAFRRLMSFTDLLLFDVKHHDEASHLAGTGVSNAQILANLRMAVTEGKPVIARIPVIPGFNNRPGDAEAFGRLLRDIGIQEANLLPFHQFGQGKYEKLAMEYDYDDVPSLQKEDLEPMKKVLETYVSKVQIGG